jgi:hypothetical protein
MHLLRLPQQQSPESAMDPSWPQSQGHFLAGPSRKSSGFQKCGWWGPACPEGDPPSEIRGSEPLGRPDEWQQAEKDLEGTKASRIWKARPGVLSPER